MKTDWRRRFAANPSGAAPPLVDIPDSMLGRISPNAIAVYGALAGCADNDTGECWPSIATLAALLGGDDRRAPHRNTVRRGVKELEGAGFIEVTHRRRLDNNGNGIPGPPSTSNLYRLLWKVTQ